MTPAASAPRNRRITRSKLSFTIGYPLLAILIYLGLIAFAITEALTGRDRFLSRRS
jgi:hypothetical protein